MKSSAWVELRKWSMANVNMDINWAVHNKLVRQLTGEEEEEYLEFSTYHRKRTESKNYVCSKCWRAMASYDRSHHKCYEILYPEPLIVFQFIAETKRRCQKATLFAIWILKKMGLHKDCVVKIGKLIYATSWDVFLWAPTFMYTWTKKKWKEKRKEPIKFQTLF